MFQKVLIQEVQIHDSNALHESKDGGVFQDFLRPTWTPGADGYSRNTSRGSHRRIIGKEKYRENLQYSNDTMIDTSSLDKSWQISGDVDIPFDFFQGDTFRFIRRSLGDLVKRQTVTMFR